MKLVIRTRVTSIERWTLFMKTLSSAVKAGFGDVTLVDDGTPPEWRGKVRDIAPGDVVDAGGSPSVVNGFVASLRVVAVGEEHSTVLACDDVEFAPGAAKRMAYEFADVASRATWGSLGAFSIYSPETRSRLVDPATPGYYAVKSRVEGRTCEFFDGMPAGFIANCYSRQMIDALLREVDERGVAEIDREFAAEDRWLYARCISLGLPYRLRNVDLVEHTGLVTRSFDDPRFKTFKIDYKSGTGRNGWN